jgi:hypothetical protein
LIPIPPVVLATQILQAAKLHLQFLDFQHQRLDDFYIVHRLIPLPLLPLPSMAKILRASFFWDAVPDPMKRFNVCSDAPNSLDASP